MGGREASAVLAQPKRVALLAYLAAATPFGFHRRDTILALFWPDADKDRARTSLRKAIHFLRHDLGHEVITGRGDEELGLAEGAVWCDVREFARRLASGRTAEALALYRGDLLPGFYVPDAPDFERWLDDERLRLQGQAADAAWTLAGRLERERETDDAARWARWACALTPDDERAVRRLIALLGRLGDRAGALRAYEELAARLRRDYDVQPSAETQDLVATLRTGRTPESAARTASGAAVAPSPAPPATVSRQYVAIFPFHVHGDGSAAYLQEGLVDMLSTNLDHAGTLHSIDPHALLSVVGPEEAARLDHERAAELAERFGAHIYVMGSVVGVAGRLRISAAVHYRSPGTGSARFITVAGPTEQLFDLVDELTGKLLSELHPGPGARFARLAAATTSSLPALKAYLEGERALRGARHEQAVEAFERAVSHDPEFALAWYRLAFFLSWPTLPQPTASESAIEEALRHKHRLSVRDRTLLEALSASLGGAAAEAERLYQDILAVHPEDVEAWLGLGQTQVFHNQQRGRRITEARGAIERVLTLDPEHATANLFLSYLAELEGNYEESDRRIADSPRQSDFVHPRIVQAFRRRDPDAMEEAMALLRRAPDAAVYDAARFVATLTFDFAAARRIAHLLLARERPPEAQAFGRIVTAVLDVAAGRPSAGRRELRTASSQHPAGALEYRGLLGILPFLPAAEDELDALQRALLAWDPAAVPHSRHPNPAFDLHHDAYPVLRLYLLGALAARAGDSQAAEYADQLDRSEGSPDAVGLARDLAYGVRARLAASRGDPAAALALLERMRMEARCTLIVMQSPFYSYTAERWLRAELLERLERDEEALRWYESLVQSSVYDLVYLAPASLHQGRIRERLGDSAGAARHYRRVLEVWGDPDPELRPALEEATTRLLRAGSPSPMATGRHRGG